MRYLTKTLDFDSRGDSVVTLGKFDGLHRGHMLLIRRVLAIGRTERLETVVFTFDVPPQSKVQHVKPHQLLTNEERRARLEQLGMDCLVECPFVDEVMHMTPEAFIKEILVDKLHAKKVVVGKDFGFGYKRSGTAEMLKEMGPSLGFETEIIEKAEENGREISSTWAREELEQGNMEAVRIDGLAPQLAVCSATITRFTARLSTVMHSAERSACRPSIRSRRQKSCFRRLASTFPR